MSVKIGTTDIVSAYIGTTAVDKIYIGTEQIWPAGGPPPAARYADYFNRADEALAANANWVNIDGSAIHILSNHLDGNGQGEYQGALANDQWSEADFTLAAGSQGAVGLSLRTTGNTMYEIGYGTFSSPPNIDLVRAIAGAYVTVASVPDTSGVLGTKKFRMEAVGTTIKVYMDGVEMISFTDANIAGGHAGVWGYNPSNSGIYLDNFRCGDMPYVGYPSGVIDRKEKVTGLITSAPVTLNHPAFTPAAGSTIVAMPGSQVENNTGSNQPSGIQLLISDTFGDTGGTAWVKSAASNRGSTGAGAWGESAEIWTRKIGTGAGSGVVTASASYDGSTVHTSGPNGAYLYMHVVEVDAAHGGAIGAVASPGPQTAVTSYDCVLGAAPVATSLVFSNFTQDYSPSLTYTLPDGFSLLSDDYDPAWQQIFSTAVATTAPQTITWSGLVATNRTMGCAVEIKMPAAVLPVTRAFDGVDDSITFSPGTLVGMTYGTLAVLVKMDHTQTAFVSNEFVGLHTSGGAGAASNVMTMRAYVIGGGNGWLTLMIDGNYQDIAWSNAGTTTWRLVVMSKGTGTVAPKVWVYDVGTSTWVTDNVSMGTMANAARTIARMNVGFDLTESTYVKGEIAAVAIWKNVALTDAQVKTMNDVVDGYVDWAALSPTVFKILDQNPVAAVVDEADATSTQTAITGTAVGSTSPFPAYAPATIVDSTQQQATAVTLTVTKPTSAVGDVLLWFGAIGEPAIGSTDACQPSTGVGTYWTLVTDHHESENSANYTYAGIWKHLCDGSEPSTFTQVGTGPGTGGGTIARPHECYMVTLRDTDFATISAGAWGNSGGSTLNVPGVTIPDFGLALLFGMGLTGFADVRTAPAGYTPIYDAASNGLLARYATAGATGVQVVASDGGGFSHAVQIIVPPG